MYCNKQYYYNQNTTSITDIIGLNIPFISPKSSFPERKIQYKIQSIKAKKTMANYASKQG